MIVRSEQGSSTYHAKGKEILGESKHIHEGHNIKLRRINDKMKRREKWDKNVRAIIRQKDATTRYKEREIKHEIPNKEIVFPQTFILRAEDGSFFL